MWLFAPSLSDLARQWQWYKNTIFNFPNIIACMVAATWGYRVQEERPRWSNFPEQVLEGHTNIVSQRQKNTLIAETEKYFNWRPHKYCFTETAKYSDCWDRKYCKWRSPIYCLINNRGRFFRPQKYFFIDGQDKFLVQETDFFLIIIMFQTTKYCYKIHK